MPVAVWAWSELTSLSPLWFVSQLEPAVHLRHGHVLSQSGVPNIQQDNVGGQQFHRWTVLISIHCDTSTCMLLA